MAMISCEHCINKDTTACLNCIHSNNLTDNYKGNNMQRCEHFWCNHCLDGYCSILTSRKKIVLNFDVCTKDCLGVS